MIRISVRLVAFVAVCALFTGYLAVTIGNIRLFSHDRVLTATFDDVTGLLVNDNVKIAGVVVGKVTGVEIEAGRAKVTFRVRDDIEIPTDSAATIRWRNLLGQRYLYLHPGTAATVLQPGEEVTETTSVIDLGEVFNRLGPIVAAIDPEQVNEFLDSITQALDGNEAQVGQVIDDLATLSEGLATRDQAIADLIVDLDEVAGTIDRRDAQIRTVLDNLVTLSTTFSANTETIDAAITDLGSVSRSAATLLANNRDEIDRSLSSLVTILATVGDDLDNVDRALGDLPEATQAIYRSGSYGEWLNQAILCFAVGPPPEGAPCATPIEKGGDGAEPSRSSPSGGRAGGGEPSPRPTGVDAVTGILGLGS